MYLMAAGRSDQITVDNTVQDELLEATPENLSEKEAELGEMNAKKEELKRIKKEMKEANAELVDKLRATVEEIVQYLP